MSRHKNPQHNRKRLVVAGIAAVTTLGVAVGIGVYGSAFADKGNTAAAQECLPAVTASSTPSATSTTTETAPPADTSTSQTQPTDTGTSSDTSTSSDTQTQTQTDTQTQDTKTGTSIPDTTTSEEMPMNNLAGGQVVALNGIPKGHGQPGGGSSAPTTPKDYTGPSPATSVPAPPPADTEQTYQGGAANCQDKLGPVATDFIKIQKVRPNNLAASPRPQRGASVGTFNVSCGTNKNGHINSANMIAAPGNVNGAQHSHDYVGNLTTDGFSTNESLAAGGTTCTNGDKSAYFWPLIRIRNKGSKAVDPLNAHNIGDPIRPVSAKIEFRGSAVGKVVAAPEFLRVLTGNAKSVSQAGVNQNAKWTCTGFENRITAKYPICPRGSQTVRIADFPGCWDGKNTDSANHRDHIAFADASGKCKAGFVAIPQLRITLKYNLPQGKVFALDAFPTEFHSPITDHNDFVNVMDAGLMNKVVNCINTGRRC